MLRFFLPLGFMALSACSEEPSQQERDAENARIVAEVRSANAALPPLVEVTPETLSLTDIDQHDMGGSACIYAPGTSLGARLIARQVDAFMKIDGEVHRLAADPGAREGPANIRLRYNGTRFSVRLTIDSEGSEDDISIGTQIFDGTLYIRDAHNRIIYEGASLVSCAL